MTLLSAFYQSVEFYVISFLIAAIIVAFSLKPSARSAARTYLLAGSLSSNKDTVSPSIELRAEDSGYVRLIRRGIEDVSSNGAVSLAITLIGFDLMIEERIVHGSAGDDFEKIDTAEFLLDFLGRERYHVKYNSESTGLFGTTTLNNRPGIVARRQLKVNA